VKRAIGIALLVLAACKSEQKSQPAAPAVTAGDAARGKALVAQYGCASCHVIPGIEGSRGRLGPSLEGIVSRKLINGRIPNTPETMASFLENPRRADPQSGMQSVGVTAEDARHISAFLFTLR
jgi:cytochrome c